MSDEKISELEKKIDNLCRDIGEIKEVLKGNSEYSESGLSWKVREDHEPRIKAMENKMVYVAGACIGASFVTTILVSLIFKLLTS